MQNDVSGRARITNPRDLLAKVYHVQKFQIVTVYR